MRGTMLPPIPRWRDVSAVPPGADPTRLGSLALQLQVLKPLASKLQLLLRTWAGRAYMVLGWGCRRLIGGVIGGGNRDIRQGIKKTWDGKAHGQVQKKDLM